MTCRNMRILLTICGWLFLAGRYATVEAQQPTRLPSVLRIRSGRSADETVAAAVGLPPATPVHQASYLAQPEYTESFPGFAGPVPPAAEDAVPVENLVGYALANNPELRAARYHACSLGAKVPQVSSLPDPQLTTVTFLQAIQTAAGPQEVMMSLSQRFPWFGKLPLRSQVAYHNAMAAYAQVTALELGVTEQVKHAYYEIYFLQRAIEVNLALEPQLDKVIDATKTRYVETTAGMVSLYQVQNELSLLRTRLIGLRQKRTEAQARLAAILHLPPRTRIDAVVKFDRTRIAHTARLLVDLAESCRPELDARRSEYSRDRASVALARRDYWPDVTLGLNWYEIGSPGLSPVATGEDSYSLAVGLNLPLYRKRLNAAVREAQYKTARSAQQYEATLDQVHQEVVTLYAQFTEHDEVFEILRSQIVPRAVDTLDLSITAYGVGKLRFEQLIQSYRDLLNYEIDRYRRESLREQAVASLERAVGCAVTTWPPQVAADPEPLAPLPRADR